ncbi:MAG: response regulator [Gammaproteobacteria bacterium]|nr:response regulator [Gammaproteobacteria bacterium]
MTEKNPSSADQTIFIIDDNFEVRHALQWLLKSTPFQVKTFDQGQHFFDYYQDASPESGCVIVDIQMPEMNGIQFLEHLKSLHISLPAIVLTAYGDIPITVAAMKAGAVDFMCKPINPQMFLEKIQQVMEQNLAHTQRIKSLSARQLQIMSLILQGKLNKQIAAELCISISTVEQHRALVMKKMEAKTLADLVKNALVMGFPVN